ncbi:MAG TPA: RNB domain-containing ribonuclease [Terriglobales bacterium]|nr:RNB domain-containing ribonuclease [Terriglobales bacterium]
MISDATLLRHIERQPKRTATLKQLLRELGVSGEERREFRARLEKLVARGELTQVERERYALPAAVGKNVVLGRLTMHRDGYGFVIPEEETVRDSIEGDIYIPPHALGSAMHGDRVRVQLAERRAPGRAEGRILGVVGRAHPTVVGTFHYGSRYNYVTPIDEKITQEIVIPHGLEWPQEKQAAKDTRGDTKGTKEARRRAEQTPHRVLGAEARHRAEFEDLEGVVVDVEITDWPSGTQHARGRVVEVLGNEDDFGVDVEIIIRKYHLPHRFPAEVMEEAQSFEDVHPASELRQRHDYRDLSIVTIDGETARDFDDAVHVRRLAHGRFELQVHIADVAHYVRPGSALDAEARLRGTSVYFPDRAVPMLPVELSTDLCSLRPQVERLVLSCVMEIDRSGDVTRYELHEGVIRSAERMTYTDVNLVLEGDPGLCRRYAPLVESFEAMRELAMILNRKRVRRGAIDFDLPEPVIEFDEFGLMRAILKSERNIAHRIIEEFMLAANECVAQHLEKRGVPSLYRIHEKPDAKKVYEFETIAATFGHSLGVGPLPIQRLEMRGERRARHGTGQRPRAIEVPREVRVTPRMYQKLTERIAGKPEERILSYLMLRSLKQARYSEENAGHFALASETYTHFTSPIRRYPDLIVHRILKEVMERDGRKERERPPLSQEVLEEIAQESSQSERRADDAERELMEWKKIRFMQDRIGEEFEALIISVTRWGLFVELMDMFVEGLVPIATLAGDRYTFRENTRQIIGERTRKKFSLGDRVRVLLDRVDRFQRKLQFAIVED